MIETSDKRNCTGCGACINACPKQIITFLEDEEGFIYPHIEADKCINCHLCEKSCPMLLDRTALCKKKEGFPLFYAGQLFNKEDLLQVSSGGAFWAFSQSVIDKGGIVYGAIQESVDVIFHFRADNTENIKRIRRSKYFQSDTKFTMREVREDLRRGLFVLYSGTGCQIAGLKAFLAKEYDNLVTCDVVCHGVPSRKVWKKYREEKEQHEGKKIQSLIFRDKSAGWSKNQYKITYEDGSIEKEPSPIQMFHAGYLKGIFYRPSCGSCRWASLPRVADVTLADFWKYQGEFRKPGADLGVSLITVNTVKGFELLQESSKYLKFEETSRELALNSCRHLDNHPKENPNRTAFFNFFFQEGYYAAAEKFIIENRNKNLFVRVFKKIFRPLKILFGK